MGQVPESPSYDSLEPRRERKGDDASAPTLQRDPVKILTGDQAQLYLDLVCRLVKAGRLNRFYPSPRGLENLYRLMSPAATHGLADSVRLNLRNGLPDEPEIGKVIADKEIAERFLRKHDVPEIEHRSDEASLRLMKRLRYYRDVVKSEVPSRIHLHMKLRRVEDNRKTAYFETVFERFDPGEGVFTRYSILLSHHHHRWSRPQIELKGDDLQYTESFRNVISRYSSDEAEFAFVLLSDVPNIKVEEVVRARVGPIWMEGVRMPQEIRELLEKHPGNLILNLPQERVSIPEKEGKTDTNCDPFARFYRQSLEPEARALADQRAHDLGYIVHKERKFSCTPGILGPLRDFLAQLGKPCVIYPAR